MKPRLHACWIGLMAIATTAMTPVAAHAVTLSDLPADVRDVLARTIEAYKNAETYRDSGRIEIRMNADDTVNAHVMPVPISFERPNRIRLNLDVLAIQSDGEELVRYSRVLNRYMEVQAPGQLTIPSMFGDIASSGIELFLHLYLLTEPEPFAVILEKAQDVTVDGDETIDGHECKRVSYASPPGRLDGQLLIDAKSGLLREFRLSAKGKEATLPRGTPAWVSLKLEDAVLNEPIEDDTFAFTPPPRAVQVDDLTKPPGEQEVVASTDGGDGENVGIAIGQVAPDFELETLEGKKVKLSDLRGQVVVLDFWAAWCGPCIRAFPFLERSHKTFADKPVMFIGVCSDRRSSMSKIESVVKQSGVTFPIAMDRDSKVQMTYQVQGLPTTMVIDQKGVIRSKHRGFSAYGISQLTKEVSELLGE